MIYDEGKGEKTLGFSQPLRKYIAQRSDQQWQYNL